VILSFPRTAWAPAAPWKLAGGLSLRDAAMAKFIDSVA